MNQHVFLPGLNAALCFLQWVIYLSLFDRIPSQSQSTFLYVATVFNFTPMALAPFILRNKMKYADPRVWVRVLISLAIAISLLFFAGLFLNSLQFLFFVLFLSSSVLGAGYAYCLAIASQVGANSEEVQKLQSQIHSSYYGGMLLATVGFGFVTAASHSFWFASFGLLVQLILAYVIFKFPFALKEKKAVETVSLSISVAQFKKYFPFFLLNSLRYFSWGIISFLFPLVVFQRHLRGTDTFAWITSLAVFCMFATSFILGSGKLGLLSKSSRWTALTMNIANGFCIYIAYMTGSFVTFVVYELIASSVCVIAEVNTSGGFIGLQPVEDRAWLSAWTSSLRAFGMAFGNLFMWAFIQGPWSLGPICLALLLSFSGVFCLGVIQPKGGHSCVPS